MNTNHTGGVKSFFRKVQRWTRHRYCTIFVGLILAITSAYEIGRALWAEERFELTSEHGLFLYGVFMLVRGLADMIGAVGTFDVESEAE